MSLQLARANLAGEPMMQKEDKPHNNNLIFKEQSPIVKKI